MDLSRRVQTELEDQLWYVGSVSERKAEEILMKLGTLGSFLLRDSLFPEANYVLSVLGVEGHTIHLPIIIGEGKSCTMNNYRFHDISTAVTFYCENRLAGVFLQPPAKSLREVIDRQRLEHPIGLDYLKPSRLTLSYVSDDTSTNETNETKPHHQRKVTFHDHKPGISDENATLCYYNREGPIYSIPHTISQPELSKKFNDQEAQPKFYQKKALFNQHINGFMGTFNNANNIAKNIKKVPSMKIPPPVPPKPTRGDIKRKQQLPMVSDDSQHSTIGVPTAMLAGIRSLKNKQSPSLVMVHPPTPPLRVESARCGILKRKSVFNSLESLIGIENEHITLTRKGSLSSLDSSPERDTTMEGNFIRLKNIVRHI